MPTWGWVLIGIFVVLLFYFIRTFNRLVRNRNEIDNAWAQVDVQLRRRYDVVGNLVNVVKGYAGHERSVLENVTAARAAAQAAPGVEELGRAENVLSQALRQLLAVVENYPDLKASQNFLALHEDLQGIEGSIALARQFFNDQVLDYNNLVQQLPSSIVAMIARFHLREYFEIEQAAAGPVQVEL